MFGGLFVVSIITACVQGIKESLEPTIPAKNWGNKELYYKDLMSGVSEKQLLKNVQNGKYIMTAKYPEPHRDPADGKIVIENCKLYEEDLFNYGAVQVGKWIKQGKYNLTSEELKKEQERIKKKYDSLCKL